MKILPYLAILTVSCLLVSCFGTKEESPESGDSQESPAAENVPATKELDTDSAGGESSGEPETDAKPAPVPAAASSSASAAEESSEGAAATTVSTAADDPAPEPAADTNPSVKISTSVGDITVELFAKEAPRTVANFLSYVNEGYYKNTVFHRVIKDFMIQGGGFALQGEGVIQQKDTRDPVQNEAKNGVRNERGTIAMARTSAPHSATSQFFINHADNENLNHPSFDGWGYTVFGKVTGGMDIVDAIAGLPTSTQELVTKAGARPMENVPNDPVVIQSITVVE